MLKVAVEPKFWAPVDISVPGQEKPVRIQVQYTHMRREAVKEFIEGSKDRPDLEILAELMHDWKGVDRKFDSDALEELLQNYHAAGVELYLAWQREVVGSKVKNF